MKILLSAVVLAATFANVARATPASAPMAMDDYATVLTNFVDDEGLVDYGELQLHPRGLERALEAVAGATNAQYDGWPRNERIAFWINVYNMRVLKLVVDHYPIQPGIGKTSYPANSIRQIPGSWEHVKFRALGRDVTLDEIAHQILRGEFNEPRVHMALVVASMSSPRLRREPYDGDTLDAQLDDQARTFLSDLRNFQIDRDAKEVWAAPVFEWFVDDFVPNATKENPLHIAQQKSLTSFAAKYVSDEDARYLSGGDYVVKYYKYDWTLNEHAE